MWKISIPFIRFRLFSQLSLSCSILSYPHLLIGLIWIRVRNRHLNSVIYDHYDEDFLRQSDEWNRQQGTYTRKRKSEVSATCILVR